MSAPGLAVLLVDDDAIVRTWVRLTLDGTEFRLVGSTGSVDGAFDLVGHRTPDLLLVDYHLEDGLGPDLVRRLRLEGVTAPALVMTANPERGLNELVREAGAQGAALKSGDAGELLRALRTVAGGGTCFDVRHPRRSPGARPLSPRERDVLRLIAKGRTNREAAAELGIGQESVKKLLQRAFAKLGVSRRAEAVTIASERGLL